MLDANETPKVPQAEVTDLPTKRQQFEKERMTRRAALRKIGIMSGVAAVALLSTDDLARMAANQLQQHGETKAIGDKLAKDFRSAGVAFAALPKESSPDCDCQCHCEYAHAAAIAACIPPWGCSIGSFLPWCADYNACIGAAGTSRTNCYINCA